MIKRTFEMEEFEKNSFFKEKIMLFLKMKVFLKEKNFCLIYMYQNI